MTGAEAAMELQNFGSGNFIDKGSSHVVMIRVTGGGSANEHEAAELRAAGGSTLTAAQRLRLSTLGLCAAIAAPCAGAMDMERM